jgi:hypothetical protein
VCVIGNAIAELATKAGFAFESRGGTFLTAARF